jgi:hypothetical protein
MAHALTSSIRGHIAALLTDQISVAEFQDWLVGATRDIEQHADSEATDLAYTSKLALAELSRGDISQSMFRERMRAHVDVPVPPR